MAITQTYAVRQAVEQALEMAGISDIGDNALAENSSYAQDLLNRMLKGWQARESFDWLTSIMSLTPVTGPSQTITPRPLRIYTVNFRRNGLDLPMEELNRWEYDTLPNKSATGTPTTYHFWKQKETATLLIWPTLAAVNGETLEITYEREFEDITSLNDTLDVPSEWWDAVVATLAARLHGHFLGGSAALTQEAAAAQAIAFSGQNTGSVYFTERGAYY